MYNSVIQMFIYIHAYILDMVKVISLADDAYEELKTMKKEGESFSEVVRRIVERGKGKSFLSLAGSWKDDKEISKVFDEIIEDRKKVKFRF